MFLPLLLLLALPTLADKAPQAPAGNLRETLAKLDAASARFTSAEARVHRESYNNVIKAVDDTSDGSIYFVRDKSATLMGLKTEGKGARTIEFKAGTLRIFNPAAACYDTVSKPGIETYLTLGFGGSGTDLAEKWEISDFGSETIDTIKTEHLDLVPKDASVKANYTKVSLWLDLDRDVTVKQIFFAATGDKNTAMYSNIMLNKKIDTNKYAFKGKPCGK